MVATLYRPEDDAFVGDIELHADAGTITLPTRSRIGMLAQEAPDGPESLLDTVLAADQELSGLLAEAESDQAFYSQQATVARESVKLNFMHAPLDIATLAIDCTPNK
mgnify:CR=1 FL=1